MQISEEDRAEAKRMLYDFETNVRLLENKTELARVIREAGSRTQQRHEERGGRASARYVDSVPGWLMATESVEWQIHCLALECIGIAHLLKFLKGSGRETDSMMYSVYELKYKGRVPDREIRKRFPKLKQIDEALISKVIDWQSDLLTPLLRKRSSARHWDAFAGCQIAGGIKVPVLDLMKRKLHCGFTPEAKRRKGVLLMGGRGASRGGWTSGAGSKNKIRSGPDAAEQARDRAAKKKGRG